MENVINIGCSLCRSFHEEKTILLSISLSFLNQQGEQEVKLILACRLKSKKN